MLRNFFRKTPLAWLQVKREKTRLAVALAGIAFADVLMFVQMGLKDALYDSAASPYAPLQADLFIISSGFENLQVVESFSRERLYQAAGVHGVESINSLYIGRGQWRNSQTRLSYTILTFGSNPNQVAFSLPEVNQQLPKLKLLNRVLYDKAGRENFFGNVPQQLQQMPSLPVQINHRSTQVVGTFTLGASFAADGNLITSDSTFLRLFPERKAHEIDIGLLKLRAKTDIQQVQAALRSRLSKDVLVLTLDELTTREKNYWSNGSPIGFIFGFGTIIGFVVGLVIVYQILYSDVSDHLSEYATLKAMGYSDHYLVSVLVQEALILAVLGFLPGLVLSTGLYFVARSATLLPISMTVSRAAMVLALTIVMCTVSGAVALRKLQAADPADVF
ncbi:FtsX-like permease family protein [Leptolyngbya sp. FACHB-321]|uniref:ABC transporter permease DevC n=1 Tax=Leptolyngbya sp. FACHB-321 TaxID=2692807 RepID=UPI001684CADD|nr:ABC transporter permease DevC [Leptolyngbya sp. FACHB-321]MBD2033465.1 FtsX-like permease family protein [Leptolyngbya sp. FACHB-321]